MIEDLKTLVEFVKHKHNCATQITPPWSVMIENVDTSTGGVRALSPAERAEWKRKQACTCGLSALLARVEGATDPPQDATTALIAQVVVEMRQALSLVGEGKRVVLNEALKRWVDHLAALSSQAPPQAWRSIDSAPKDGTEILAVTETGQRVVVQWGSRAAWPDKPFWIGAEFSPLTYWQPLPLPPADRIDPSSGAGQT